MVVNEDDEENINENGTVAEGEDRVENDGNKDDNLYNYKEDNGDENFESSSVENDVADRLLRFMKSKTFTYIADGKINVEVGQVLESVEHFRKVLKNYNI